MADVTTSNGRHSYLFTTLVGVVAAAIIGVVIAASTAFITISSRVSVLESQRTMQEAFYAETRSALDKISAQVSDLRVLVATEGIKGAQNSHH